MENSQEIVIDKIRNYLKDYANENTHILEDISPVGLLAEIICEDIEYKSRDGFIPYTDGGAYLSTYVSAIEFSFLPENSTLKKFARKQMQEYFELCSQGVSADDDENMRFWEEEFLALASLNIQLYDIDNSRNDFFGKQMGCYISFAINFEYPYYRQFLPAWAGGELQEWIKDINFGFDNLEDFKLKLPKYIKKLEKKVNKK